MKIDGKALAEKILNDLSLEVVKLKRQGVTPTLAVIQVGENPASTAYIRQKQKAAAAIGAKLVLSHQPSDVSYQQLQKIIEGFNNDPAVHSVILQRPLPELLTEKTGELCSQIKVSKDVDGFLPNSPYPVPVAAAVIMILEEGYRLTEGVTGSRPVIKQGETPSKIEAFVRWLREQSVIVLGRGETAGKPIAEALIKRGCNVAIVHSQTPKPDDQIRAADIIISCVGKLNVVRRDNIKEGAMLLSVGISRDASGKLHGDYEEEAIKDLSSFYTPTPGGVGPVNVACLMTNLLQAASKLL